MSCNCEEEITVIQKLNRTLRQVNKNIRARLQAKMEEMDELFLLLCATNKQAEEALWEVWSTGRFKCDPDDYLTLAALVKTELDRINPVPVSDTNRMLEENSKLLEENGKMLDDCLRMAKDLNAKPVSKCIDCVNAYPGPPCPKHSAP